MRKIGYAIIPFILNGCTQEPTYDGCYGEHPAFVVTIRSNEGPLPPDTRLHVKYGSGEERYSLREPNAPANVIFCATIAGDGAPDAGGAVQALVCELWTQGAAQITVEASGYPSIMRNLKAQRNRCGIETVDDEFLLQARDGG